jgi:hypothetical protein
MAFDQFAGAEIFDLHPHHAPRRRPFASNDPKPCANPRLHRSQVLRDLSDPLTGLRIIKLEVRPIEALLGGNA